MRRSSCQGVEHLCDRHRSSGSRCRPEDGRHQQRAYRRAAWIFKGFCPFTDLQFFVEFCHYRGVRGELLPSSIDSFQAQQLWVSIPELDPVSTREQRSAVAVDPLNRSTERKERATSGVLIKRSLVRGLTAPEHGGVLNFSRPVEGEIPAAKPGEGQPDRPGTQGPQAS